MNKRETMKKTLLVPHPEPKIQKPAHMWSQATKDNQEIKASLTMSPPKKRSEAKWKNKNNIVPKEGEEERSKKEKVSKEQGEKKSHRKVITS